MNRPGQRRATSFATLMLMYQLFQVANESGIPPVTTFFIGGQILLFLGILQVPWTDPSEICMSYDKIWNRRQYRRLLFGAFEHSDDFHLYYNMISFMWKGKSLEQLYGSGYFLMMVTVFTALSNLTYIFLNYLLSILLFDETFKYSCAVGFSGTLFALKVVTTELIENRYDAMSFANKYGVWIELFYISFITPNASFVGHLAGILVGLFYVRGPILKPLMDSLHSSIMAIWYQFNPPNANEQYEDESERFRRQQQQRFENQNYYANQNPFRRRTGFSPFGF